MKRNLSIIIVLLLTFTLCACSQLVAGKSDVLYPKFAYPLSAEPLSREDISFNIPQAQIEKLQKSVTLYSAEPITLDDDYLNKIFDVFGFQNYSSNVDKVTNITNYYMDNKQISIYPNGLFTFETSYDNDRTDFPFNMDDEEVKQKAKEFLETSGLLPSGFVLTDKSGGESVTFEENGEQKTVITSKGAWFQNIIDGIEVYGTSKITVYLNTDGVCSVYSVYSKTGESVKVDLIGIDEAIERAKTAGSLLMWDMNKMEGSIVKAVADQVKIVYYDDPLDKNSTHIQPCYSFEGMITDELNNESAFMILVPAMAKEIYIAFPG